MPYWRVRRALSRLEATSFSLSVGALLVGLEAPGLGEAASGSVFGLLPSLVCAESAPPQKHATISAIQTTNDFLPTNYPRRLRSRKSRASTFSKRNITSSVSADQVPASSKNPRVGKKPPCAHQVPQYCKPSNTPAIIGRQEMIAFKKLSSSFPTSRPPSLLRTKRNNQPKPKTDAMVLA